MTRWLWWLLVLASLALAVFVGWALVHGVVLGGGGPQ